MEGALAFVFRDFGRKPLILFANREFSHVNHLLHLSAPSWMVTNVGTTLVQGALRGYVLDFCNYIIIYSFQNIYRATVLILKKNPVCLVDSNS